MITRKLTSLIIVFTLCASMLAPSAAAVEPAEETQTYTINEYDYVSTVSESSADELSELGLTQQEAENVVSAFEEGLEERAALPEQELQGFGYSDDEISILKDYAEGQLLTDSEYRAIAGTCTGNISLRNCGTKYATFYYTWDWDHCPVITLTDSASVRWLAYDAQGYDFSVIKTSVSSSVDYYYNGSVRFTRSANEEPGLEFNTVNYQFKVTENFTSNTGITEQAYAKHGKIAISVNVDSSVNNNINYILVAGLYGHTTIGTAAPSVSLSPSGSISIDFSGNISIDSIGARKAKISTGSIIEYI